VHVVADVCWCVRICRDWSVQEFVCVTSKYVVRACIAVAYTEVVLPFRCECFIIGHADAGLHVL
jgi:hypothetical protein